MSDDKESRGPFTDQLMADLDHALHYMANSPLPGEMLDAFLAEYVETRDVNKSLFRAMCEWDC